MPKIFFCGDPHGQYQHIVEAVREHRPLAIVLLGDLQPQRPLEQELASVLNLTEVWWIHGNHDTDSEADYDNLFGSALVDRNLHGKVVDVAGIHIAGLGGIFRGQIWGTSGEARFVSPQAYLSSCGKGNTWRGGLPRKHRSSTFPSDIEALRQEHADILVTHEAPTCHRHGSRDIDQLADRLGVTMLFHGHHHQTIDYGSLEAQRLGFRAFGVGLHSILDQDGRVILTGAGT